jgi:hypothetical protein
VVTICLLTASLFYEKERWKMKSIAFTYPGFHDLPRGIKQLLMMSENTFFENASAQRPNLRTSVGSVIRPFVPSGSPFRQAMTALPNPV